MTQNFEILLYSEILAYFLNKTLYCTVQDSSAPCAVLVLVLLL